MSELDDQSRDIESIRKAMKSHKDLLELLLEGESDSAAAREKLSGKMMFLFALTLLMFMFGVYQYQKVSTLEKDLGEMSIEVTNLETSLDDLTVLVRGHNHPHGHDWLHTHYR